MKQQLDNILLSQDGEEENTQIRAVTQRLLASIDSEMEPDVAY